MNIDAQTIQSLRSQTGAGIVDCKNALAETNGDIAKAAEILRKKGIAKAASKGERVTKEGRVASYVHSNNKVGVLVEIQCETDFVARTEAFQNFVNDVAMQIAAMNPLYVSREQVPAEVVEKEKEIAMAEFADSPKPKDVIEKIASGKIEKFFGEVCLVDQKFIKDEDVTIGELLKQTIAKTGENMRIVRFARFAMGE